MTRPFTGRHMAAILVAFFGVVIAINVLMARLALGTFGGTVVDNSYVASQRFNIWLDQARRQEALGWQVALTLDKARHAEITLGTNAAGDVSAAAIARHPLGRAPDMALCFRSVAPNRLRSVEALPLGRWALHLTIRQGHDQLRLIEAVQ